MLNSNFPLDRSVSIPPIFLSRFFLFLPSINDEEKDRDQWFFFSSFFRRILDRWSADRREGANKLVTYKKKLTSGRSHRPRSRSSLDPRGKLRFHHLQIIFLSLAVHLYSFSSALFFYSQKINAISSIRLFVNHSSALSFTLALSFSLSLSLSSPFTLYSCIRVYVCHLCVTR